MIISPNWFLYSAYEPADTVKFLSVMSIAYALGLSHKTMATKLAQHGRIGRWIFHRAAGNRRPPN
ncbi:hypothetical protein PMO31116_02337 [Pandoraea morbifera]|uniref:Uncharacterized protein n=1 Tax=Pandoraea morbifera TaxID=2508300 RepID=A0A5E4V2A6_9BURK|nr:hypothetical protein PMO31116_02337 [Pandoraea morbifera]